MAASVELRLVTPDSEPVLRRLWQLYRHDLSEFRGMTPDADGLFTEHRLDAWLAEEEVRAYLIHRATGGTGTGSGPVGLALVRGVVTEPRAMAEFFVVRAVRRQQVGREAALALLRMHPGRWEIAFQEENPGAARFWRGVSTAVADDTWSQERRPVPGKPEIPPDVWISLDTRTVGRGRRSSGS